MASTFPQRLALVLDQSKLNQTDFSKRIRSSQPFLSQLLSGKKSPSDKTIGYICKEFSVNEEWLRTGEGQMKNAASEEQEVKSMIENALDGDADFVKAVVKVICTRTKQEREILEKTFWDIVYNLPEKKKGQDES